MSSTGSADETVLAELNERLPRGYRARRFEDADREPLVEEGNAEGHPMERESAEEWRRWERMIEDPTRIRIVVVTGDGGLAGMGVIQAGPFARPDGAQIVNAHVHRAHRRRGVGTALLDALEAEARRRTIPRALSGVSAARPDALAWAERRGYREIGRRILSYRELDSYDPGKWRDALERASNAGIAFRSFTEILAGRGEAEQERFWRGLWEAEAPMWEDIPFSSPTPHWPYDVFRKTAVENPAILRDLSLVAYAGDVIAGYTLTGDRQGKDAVTYMTGVAREHRGRGIAMALKVDVLARAKAKGLRAMTTVNDEPNKAMRGVNIKLGYQAVPDHVELEKRF